MDRYFANARNGLGTGLIDVDTGVVKAVMVRGYTYNAAHTFVSDITGAGGTLVGTPQTLATPTFADGVLDSPTDPTFTAVAAGAAIDGVLIYQASAVGGGADVAASAQRVIALIDGKVRFTVAQTSAANATSLVVDPLLLALANAAVASKISGAGGSPATVTLAAAAAADARALTVAALGSGITVTVGDVYEVAYSGGNLPITPNGGDINISWSNGANRILRI